MHLIGKTSFVWIGGAGCTLGLLIASILAGKKVRERYKVMTSLSTGPGIFNINEPVIFGWPIVLNPIFMVPFVFVPVILSVFSYIMIDIGLVHPTTVSGIPWTTPVGMSGFLTTGHWSGAALSVFNLLLSVVLYLPFVKLAVSLEEKQMEKRMKEEQESVK